MVYDDLNRFWTLHEGEEVEAHTGITVSIYDDKIEATEYDALGHVPLFIQVCADVSLPITSNIMNESRVR